MQQIRQGVFETNSSSTHAFCLCLKSEYNAWVNGDMRFDINKYTGKQLVTKEEAIEYCKNRYSNFLKCVNEDGEDYTLNMYSFYSYEWYCDYENECADEKEFEEIDLPNGDGAIAFWFYGHD